MTVEGKVEKLPRAQAPAGVRTLSAKLQLREPAPGHAAAVVVANRLGALNHTLLTVQAIRTRGLECAGLILNHALPPTEAPDIATTTNRVMLEDMLDVPILFEITHGQRETRTAAGRIARVTARDARLPR